MIWFAIIISLIFRLLSKPFDPVNIGVGVFSVIFVYYLSFFVFKAKSKKWLAYIVALLISTSPLYVLLSKYLLLESVWAFPVLLIVVPGIYLLFTYFLSKLNDKVFPIILVFVVFVQMAFSLGLLL